MEEDGGGVVSVEVGPFFSREQKEGKLSLSLIQKTSIREIK